MHSPLSVPKEISLALYKKLDPFNNQIVTFKHNCQFYFHSGHISDNKLSDFTISPLKDNYMYMIVPVPSYNRALALHTYAIVEKYGRAYGSKGYEAVEMYKRACRSGYSMYGAFPQDKYKMIIANPEGMIHSLGTHQDRLGIPDFLEFSCVENFVHHYNTRRYTILKKELLNFLIKDKNCI